MLLNDEQKSVQNPIFREELLIQLFGRARNINIMQVYATAVDKSEREN